MDKIQFVLPFRLKRLNGYWYHEVDNFEKEYNKIICIIQNNLHIFSQTNWHKEFLNTYHKVIHELYKKSTCENKVTQKDFDKANKKYAKLQYIFDTGVMSMPRDVGKAYTLLVRDDFDGMNNLIIQFNKRLQGILLNNKGNKIITSHQGKILNQKSQLARHKIIKEPYL